MQILEKGLQILLRFTVMFAGLIGELEGERKSPNVVDMMLLYLKLQFK